MVPAGVIAENPDGVLIAEPAAALALGLNPMERPDWSAVPVNVGTILGN